MSTIAASIVPKLLELDFKFGTWLFYGECRADAQIIFPKSGRGGVA